MRVPHVITQTGQPVTLQFGLGRVEVFETSPARPRAVRACAGGLLLGTGLAAVAVNAGDRVITGLDLAVWIAVGAVVLLTLGGAIWWFILARRDRRRTAEAIPASSVLNARSRADSGRVTVTLEFTEGEDRSFTAVGHAGSLLSAEFSRLLSVTT